jgi:hypothetical protein
MKDESPSNKSSDASGGSVFRIPEVIWNGRVALQQMQLGVDPDRMFSRPELRLAPNESLEIPLAARHGDIRTLVKAAGSGFVIENVKGGDRIPRAMLDDKTLFLAGVWYRRGTDPNHPHRWNPIKEK